MSDATLVIRTGLQGHGKTINAIKELDEYAFKNNRVVYYHNITDLKPELLKASWFEFEDPHNWYELPNDSVIVVDEAQGWFGVRDPRSTVPPHISSFEIMRKKGHEVHLITQDPRFIDVHARRLCGRHIHYRRVFGSNKVARYEYHGVVADVEKITSNKDVDRTYISLDKKFFGVYSSAQAQHHFKFKPSRKAVFFSIAIVVASIMVVRAVLLVTGGLSSSGDTEAVDAPTASPPAGTLVGSVSNAILGSMGAPVAQMANDGRRGTYLEDRTPRISNVPSSAPVYDGLTAPVAFPRMYCVASRDHDLYSRNHRNMAAQVVNGEPTVCQCYTQQATRVEVEFAFCISAVERGFFDPTIPDRSLRPQDQRSVPSHAQLAHASSVSSGPAVGGLLDSRPDVLQASPAPAVAFLQPERGTSPAQNATAHYLPPSRH